MPITITSGWAIAAAIVLATALVASTITYWVGRATGHKLGFENAKRFAAARMIDAWAETKLTYNIKNDPAAPPVVFHLQTLWEQKLQVAEPRDRPLTVLGMQIASLEKAASSVNTDQTTAS